MLKDRVWGGQGKEGNVNEWFLGLFTWPTGQMLVLLTEIGKISGVSGVGEKEPEILDMLCPRSILARIQF